MAVTDRLRGAARALFGRTPSAVPGSPPAMLGSEAQPNAKLASMLNSVGALFGRTTYGAGPSPTRYSSYPGSGLDPAQIVAIHQTNFNGFPQLKQELDEQILERDAHLGGLYEARIVEVSGKPFRLHPKSDTPLSSAVASFVEAVVHDIDGFDDDIEDLLSANARGYSVSEIVWDFGRIRAANPAGVRGSIEILRPWALDYVHQKHFRFDLVTDEPSIWFTTGQAKLPPGKFVFHKASGPGFVERRGYMIACTWLHAAKSWALRDWLVYSNIYGLPQIQGIYDGDTEQLSLHRSIYETLLRDFGHGKPVIHPREFDVKVDPAPTGGRADDVFGALVGWANSEMSKRVQHETLTTEMGGVGSYNASETHADVKNAGVRSDARKLAQTLRTDLLKPIVELNALALARAWGENPDDIIAEVPRMSWRIERETTPEVRARIYATAVNELGVELDPDQFHDEFGFDRPRGGNKPLAGKPIAIASGGAAVGSLDAGDGVSVPKPEPDAPPAPSKEQAATEKLTRQHLASQTLANLSFAGVKVKPAALLRDADLETDE